ncbi:tyrosine-type recombinase/integrase [Vreelandella jeotgali]|uniref:tyrosine-type recombinase/integrase n=1 Tax=Vreelandella jeotgali TaxID=553386 RepID=UPI000347AD6E|nr:site-specific integrase [Halomonas jeotgali]
MPRKNLTQKFVNSAPLPTGKQRENYYDTECPGLCLEVRANKRSFHLRYRNYRTKWVQRRLADAKTVKLTEMRTRANQLKGRIALGEDPFEEQAALRDVPRFEEFVNTHYMPYAQSYKRSWKSDESMLRNHILPAIGRLHMDEVARGDIVNLISKHRRAHKPSSTNRILILVRFIYNCAIKWEAHGVNRNPTNKIESFPMNNKRERYLTNEEAQRLLKALDQSDAPTVKYIVMMLLLTGARKSEVTHAQWKDIDRSMRLWRIERNKSGKTRFVPLSNAALRMLDQVPRYEGCPWIFPNPQTRKPYEFIYASWNTARRRAGLEDVRIHDLRHSFASFLINNGRSIYEVQQILGHTQITTTERYSHLSRESLLEAADAAGSMVGDASDALDHDTQSNAAPIATSKNER